ncbi:MAG: AI-2E family transporter [Candidatus Ornithospirochaeta sp.]|nr:AI-2E family transporter [Candidatus Ornithospirochaeta sp.]
MDYRADISRQVRNILGVICAFLILYVMKVGSEVIIPIVISFFVYIFVNPILNRLEKLHVPKIIATVIVLLLVLVIFVLLCYIMFLMVNMLIQKLPYYQQRVIALDRLISQHIAPFLDEDPEDISFLALLNIDWFGIAMSSLTSISSKFLGILSDAMLIYVYLMFIILERQTIAPKILVAFERSKGERAMMMIGRMSRQMSKYLLIKLLISGATGLLFYFASLISGLDFALVWGVLAFILNFIPTIGSILVTAGAILMAIIQFMPHWGMVIYVAVLMIAIEMILGNIIDPRLQGIQLNMSPLIILFSLAIWGYVWGIVGMFLAVPLTSIIQIICANIPGLKPVAIMISTGKNYRKSFDKQKKKNAKAEDNAESYDVEFPEGPNPSSGE